MENTIGKIMGWVLWMIFGSGIPTKIARIRESRNKKMQPLISKASKKAQELECWFTSRYDFNGLQKRPKSIGTTYRMHKMKTEFKWIESCRCALEKDVSKMEEELRHLDMELSTAKDLINSKSSDLEKIQNYLQNE